MTCPTCGHTPTVKRVKPIVDVATMNEAERRAFFTRTAPYGDIQFFLDCRQGLSKALVLDVLTLALKVDNQGNLTGITRSEFYRQYYRLSARRRQEREDLWCARMEHAAVAA